MILEPLNDPRCLSLLHARAQEDSRHPVFRELARAFRSPAELAAFIRTRPFQVDLGDPLDGPRVPCQPSQRLRRLPERLNCYEATCMYMTLAEIIAPDVDHTSATLRLEAGYHTFPVDDGVPVILDSIMPRNALQATVDHCCGTRPSQPLRWALALAKHARCSPRTRMRTRNGLRQIASAVRNGQPIGRIADVAMVLALAQAEAQLWGPDGMRLYHAAERELRDYFELADLLPSQPHPSDITP